MSETSGTSNPATTEQLATRFLETLEDENVPFCSGTIKLPPRALVLYYGKNEEARRIDFGRDRGDETELDKLEKACDPATFGRNQEDVLDESYRKAGKLDAEHFSLGFDVDKAGIVDAVRAGLLRQDAHRPVVAELYKLNVYGKDAFFKAHQDTPRGANMFGSLVVVFPSLHEGGTLLLRHQGKEWAFDSAQIFADLGTDASSHIAFVAFYSDVEHEVLPVLSGHRVTVTWNLYYGSKVDAHKPAQDLQILQPVNANEANIESALKALLEDEHLLPDGGLLGFGLRHEYPIDPVDRSALKHITQWLKGSDAALYAACTSLGLEATVRFVVDDDDDVYAMFGQVPNLDDDYPIDSSREIFREIMDNCGGVPLKCRWATLEDAYDPEKLAEDADVSCFLRDYEMDEVKIVYWVTDSSSATSRESEYLYYGNEATTASIYAQVCLIVEVSRPKRISAPERASDEENEEDEDEDDMMTTKMKMRRAKRRRVPRKRGATSTSRGARTRMAMNGRMWRRGPSGSGNLSMGRG